MAERVSYEVFKRQVDALVWRKVGLSYDDLPDLIAIGDEYEAGSSANVVANKAVRAAKREYGF